MDIKWILERNVFKDKHQALADVLTSKGVDFLDWNEDWEFDERFPKFKDYRVIFHGSLGNASMIVRNQLWELGAFCNVESFKCTSWYKESAPWLFQQNWFSSTVEDFVKNQDSILSRIEDTFFVRPNSPLKPFSGRVLTKDTLSMEALDFGFYYDNPKEEIIVSSIQEVFEEWRYVVCKNEVITGSAYLADNREATDSSWRGKPLELAQEIASKLNISDDIYILDICNSEKGLKLLELNPFSGADLYNCEREKIVDCVTKLFNG